ncbi:hypothetical protein F4677DRAFT_450477 [Hypoxylon crocopeplum]|nr:hypothetical protein F4677DRAFT_450477 [Hypoxylon crocopeplum]
MKLLILSLFIAATSVSASPLEVDAAVEIRAPEQGDIESRQTASGCNYFAAPRCCVPTICQCANGWVYQLNQDNMNRGLHGCDPPWGFISKSNSQFPGYCC